MHDLKAVSYADDDEVTRRACRVRCGLPPPSEPATETVFDPIRLFGGQERL